MKVIGHILNFAVKLAVLASLLVVVLEAMDRMAEKNRFRYTITEDFEE